MISILNPYVIGGALLTVLLIGGGGYIKGRIDSTEICEGRHAAAALVQAAEAQRREQEAQRRVADAEARAAAATAQVRIETRTIIQKVPVHVTPEIDRRYPLPYGFVRVLDAAASRSPVSEIPLPAGKSDGDPAPVTASAAATVIAGNYGEYHACVEQVKGWRSAWEGVVITSGPTP